MQAEQTEAEIVAVQLTTTYQEEMHNGIHEQPQRTQDSSVTIEIIDNTPDMGRIRKRHLETDSKPLKKPRRNAEPKDQVLMVPEYSKDIFHYFHQVEGDYLPTHNYLTDNSSTFHLKPSMRAVLIDWLIEVQQNFQYSIETLLLAINLMDRFLSQNKVVVAKLQLLAITSLFIAAKFEEVEMPKIAQYAYITDGAATKEDIQIAEKFILSSLNFNISWPNPMNFMRKICKDHGTESDTCNKGQFLLEYALCCPDFIDIKPSDISNMAMYLADWCDENKNNNQNYLQFNDNVLSDIPFQENCRKLAREIAKPTITVNSLLKKFQKSVGGSMYEVIRETCQKLVANNFYNFAKK